jgi:signal transduction histidine kinase
MSTTASRSTAYFVVAEALTNVVKHARARRAAVVVRLDAGDVRVEIRDDGAGGASATGSGLVGLADRVATFAGALEIESPSGGGTCVAASIPLRPG